MSPLRRAGQPPTDAAGRPLDDDLDAVWRCLADYHGRDGGWVLVHRPHWASVHALIVSPDFTGMERWRRDEVAHAHLSSLPDDVKEQLAQVSPRAPGEPVPPGFPVTGWEPEAGLYEASAHVFHRRAPREVWAVVPMLATDRSEDYTAGYTFDAVPTRGRVRWVTGGDGARAYFPTVEVAAAAALEAAEASVDVGELTPELATAA